MHHMRAFLQAETKGGLQTKKRSLVIAVSFLYLGSNAPSSRYDL
jgi:hypothetical protein